MTPVVASSIAMGLSNSAFADGPNCIDSSIRTYYDYQCEALVDSGNAEYCWTSFDKESFESYTDWYLYMNHMDSAGNGEKDIVYSCTSYDWQ